jgi:hypothetical protein
MLLPLRSVQTGGPVAFESGNIPKETLDYLESKNGVRTRSQKSVIVLLLLLIVIVVSFMIFGDSSPSKTSDSESKIAPQPVSDTGPYDPKEDIAQAKRYLAAKDYEGALMEIDFLHPEDRDRPEVQKMYDKASSEKSKIARRTYAAEYEKRLLAAGQDATVTVGSPDSNTLNISFVLINRPFVYQIENDSNLNAEWKRLGFRSIHLSDGYDSSWSYKLQ